MNTKLFRVALSCSLLGLVALQGCQATGAERVDQTSTRLEEFGASIETLKGQVTAAAAALTQVVETASLDPKPAYDEFSKQVGLVSSSAKKARTGLEKAKSEGAKLFDDWTKRLDTITDPDIRAASEKRRNDLQEALTTVTEEAEPCLTELEAFVVTATDLDTYLSQDLTPAGIDGISDKAESLARSAESINGSLDGVLETTTEVAPTFATAKPPPPPPAD